MHYASYGQGAPAWAYEIARRLLRNDPSITFLLGRNPFQGEQPPRAIAAVAYRYEPTLDLTANNYWNRTRLWRKVIVPKGFKEDNRARTSAKGATGRRRRRRQHLVDATIVN